MKIKYVGVKLDGETAFSGESGIALWLDGDSHEVKDAVAAKMLKHPDVFALDEGLTAATGDEAIIPPEVADLLAMSKEQLQELAKSKDLKVHHNAGIETLIKAIQAAK
jgi:hypothetical protein